MFSIKCDKVVYKSNFDYTILEIQDLSTTYLNRCCVRIGLKKTYDKNSIRLIIKEVTNELSKNEGYDFDVVWIYINPIKIAKRSISSVWLARVLWTTIANHDEKSIMKARELYETEYIDKTTIYWNWQMCEEVRLKQKTIEKLNSRISDCKGLNEYGV